LCFYSPLPSLIKSSATFIFATTSTSEVSPPVLPKGDLEAPSVRSRFKKKRDPAADEKDIDFKPSVRSGSSPTPSAPGDGSSIFFGSSAFFPFCYDLNIRSVSICVTQGRSGSSFFLFLFQD
jgi:hypothetical protein